MENLPIVHKENLFNKIIKFFKNVFFKKTKENKAIKVEEKTFKEDMKYEVEEDISKKYQKIELIEQIEKNPELLNDLSLDRLKQLNQYYDEIILDYKKKINVLKNTM